MIFCTDPSLGNFDYAVEVFRFIKDPCLFVYDVMIKAFAKMSSFRSAVELFWRLKEEELCPYKLTYPFVLKPLDAWDVGFVGTWNVTISRYARCRRFEEALDMFRRMSCESNDKPDEATVVTTISAYTASKTLELGKEIHEYVRSELGFTTRTGNVVVEYIGMKPDDFTFIVVLTDCVHRGLVDEGCEYFNSKRKIYEIERG
ncbi:pentatricopeptide repeat-containing protein [Pyrus ussuriensis x Pyrus communis]|uniref:Pentatricopeptide repeat-containing protein n=1 Tax=Pyrus ussuriensis x Pyrus communis TaxID=2448454 RepID=A0A5N5GTW0_9ROSA|nr:pentatricopeptide repeat-containing protein [Pyrus ussuriensis x Pyrus communis]